MKGSSATSWKSGQPVPERCVCENPITDYQGQDDQPVRVIVFTIAPDEDQESYLQLLSSISRRLRNPELISELIGSVGNTVNILEILKRDNA